MDFIFKPAAFVIIILLGYVFKTIGFLEKKDVNIVTKLLLNVTLPAAVIEAFAQITINGNMLFIVVAGFLCSLLPMLIMYVLSVNSASDVRAFTMINMSGFNIGCFSLPFVQAFFGAKATVLACLFDTGNAIMMTGGSYAITSTLLKTNPEEKNSPLAILMKFIKSFPFDVYILMLIISFCGFHIPQSILTLLNPIAQANSFLAMLMIGMMFNPQLNAVKVKLALKIVMVRLIFGGCFSLILFNLPGFDLFTRQILSIIAFAPASTLAPVYTVKCHGDGELSSFTNSLTIFVSLVVMTIVTLRYIAV
ncbi:AEC family transporter [Sodalis sp. C49]|uniref:AEC family transporter n=1 Tax=Sodalis sp. C49 TaxID=3228929 RepID=UPI003965BA2D